MIPSFSTTYDDPAPIDMVRRNGYYQVGDQKFNHKINALEYATKTKNQVTWEFSTDIFRSSNWRESTGIGLRELYRLRAQQIRDRYDYVALCFSGGSDSTTILRSFLDNKIHLDEIIVEWPNDLIRTPTSNEPSPENYIHEWALSIQPKLGYIIQNHPSIRITKVDLTSELGTEDNEDTCTFILHHNYYTIKRYRAIDRRLKTISQTHPNMCAVLGIEKPLFHIERNILSFFFVDSGCYFKTSWQTYNRNIEYFYWSPDLPEIVREQAQSVYRYLSHKPEHTYLFDKRFSPDIHTQYREYKSYERLRDSILKSIIYPDWDLNTFQADKHDSLINNNQYRLIALPETTREIQSWRSNLQSRWAMIDDQYKIFFKDASHTFKEYQRFFSRLYPVGILPKIES